MAANGSASAQPQTLQSLNVKRSRAAESRPPAERGGGAGADEASDEAERALPPHQAHERGPRSSSARARGALRAPDRWRDGASRNGSCRGRAGLSARPVVKCHETLGPIAHHGCFPIWDESSMVPSPLRVGGPSLKEHEAVAAEWSPPVAARRDGALSGSQLVSPRAALADAIATRNPDGPKLGSIFICQNHQELRSSRAPCVRVRGARYLLDVPVS